MFDIIIYSTPTRSGSIDTVNSVDRWVKSGGGQLNVVRYIHSDPETYPTLSTLYYQCY